jgi:DNA-directed RNA polymerase subunit RPC12/RpoP
MIAIDPKTILRKLFKKYLIMCGVSFLIFGGVVGIANILNIQESEIAMIAGVVLFVSILYSIARLNDLMDANKNPYKMQEYAIPQECLYCGKTFYVEEEDIENSVFFDCPFCKNRLFFKDGKLRTP